MIQDNGVAYYHVSMIQNQYVVYHHVPMIRDNGVVYHHVPMIHDQGLVYHNVPMIQDNGVVYHHDPMIQNQYVVYHHVPMIQDNGVVCHNVPMIRDNGVAYPHGLSGSLESTFFCDNGAMGTCCLFSVTIQTDTVDGAHIIYEHMTNPGTKHVVCFLHFVLRKVIAVSVMQCGLK